MNRRGQTRLLFIAAGIFAAYQVTSTQQLSYSRGQTVSPAFEGWEENADGSFNMMFGYMNRNWEEEIDVPIGPENTISPGVPDQGQPTHFLPRRNRFVFKVRVPADWGKKEMIWTLTTKGKTERAYGTLATDAKVDNLVQASEQGAIGAGISSPAIRANVPPTQSIDGGDRNAQVGKPLTIIAYAKDDGVPRPRFGPGSAAADRVAKATNTTAPPRGAKVFDRVAQTPPAAITVGSQTGLRHSCFVLPRRGPRDVRSAAGEGVGRHARGRELAVGAALVRAGGAAGWQVRGEHDVRGSGRLHDPLPGVGRRAQHAAGSRGDGEVGPTCVGGAASR